MAGSNTPADAPLDLLFLFRKRKKVLKQKHVVAPKSNWVIFWQSPSLVLFTRLCTFKLDMFDLYA